METPKEYYYTYYSYEEWGRGYFGSRGCECLPEEDVKYFGTFKDKTFKPTQKIILKDDYSTREEALADEIILHQYYKVVENPHFANKAYQTSTKFYYILSPEQARENGKITGNKMKKNKTGIFGMSKVELSEAGKKGGSKSGSKNCKNLNSQKWMCLETGYITNPGALIRYQKKRGIDTSKRRRIS